ncbi:TRAP transporter small permease [Sulfurimonas sp.]|uniref:TRAP transporter small permease n=1 Tax=Sulfurimonas sp. TaxID=2022749 RepID=UPI0025D58A94|nr:TRAP transporter small permease [Sulfurimonas sp.]
MFSILDKTVGFINQSIAVFGISAGVALAFVNVVARYLFDASLTWAAELTVFLFLWSAFFGAAYCFKKDAHIAVTIILDIVPSYIAKAFLIISHIITIGFLLAVSYYGYEYILFVIEIEEMSIDLEIPMWIPYLVIPISFLFGAFRVSEKLYEIIITPHDKVVQESEAEMYVSSIGECTLDQIEKKEHIKDIVDTVNRKTGGML